MTALSEKNKTALSGKYAAYPEYKESGVEWLGDTPKYWKAKPLKFLCTYNDEVLADSVSDDYEIEYVDIGSVSATEGVTKTESMVFGKAPSRARRMVRDGDVIISTVRTYLEAIAPIDNPPENLVVSTGFAVIRPNRLLHKGYAAYCLRASGFIKEVVAQSVGISYPAINASDLVNIKVPEPMYDEQQTIANFLDYETAKIDTLVEKQQQLIKLLKEKRQAVISHAVTKGLPSPTGRNVPMRDSGVEWLGEVPEHWKILTVRNLIRAQILETQDGNHGEQHPVAAEYVDVGVPFLMANNVQKGKIYNNGCKYISLNRANKLRIGFAKAGDVLLTHKGTVGEVGLIPESIDEPYWMLTPQVTYYRWMHKKYFNKYFYMFFQSKFFQEQLKVIGGKQSTRAYVGLVAQGDLLLVVPPLNEQIQIYTELERTVGKYEYLISKAESTVSLLNERRTALISAAVTGKIDVRNWVAPEENKNKDVA